MTDEERKLASEAWIECDAVVDRCETRFWADGDDSPADLYLVKFSYRVKNQIYGGTYKAGTLQEPGHTFTISFNPKKPQENSADERRKLTPGRLIAIFLVILACLAAAYLWGNQDWLQN